MKQYLPMKPVKRGIKVWVRADSVTGYFCDCDIYVGRPAGGTQTEEGLVERVVLLDSIQSRGLYGCGTTRYTRRGFPETLKNVSLERGEHVFCQRGDLVASVWMDKKPVTMLSTLAQADVTHTCSLGVSTRRRDEGNEFMTKSSLLVPRSSSLPRKGA